MLNSLQHLRYKQYWIQEIIMAELPKRLILGNKHINDKVKVFMTKSRNVKSLSIKKESVL